MTMYKNIIESGEPPTVYARGNTYTNQMQLLSSRGVHRTVRECVTTYSRWRRHILSDASGGSGGVARFSRTLGVFVNVFDVRYDMHDKGKLAPILSDITLGKRVAAMITLPDSHKGATTPCRIARALNTRPATSGHIRILSV